MNTCTIVPVKTFANGKSRLAHLLTVDERIRLSEAMLYDVLSSVCSCKSINNVIVVSRDERALSIAEEFATTVVREEEERGVNIAVSLTDEICSHSDASIVIPQDLPLILPEDIDMLCSSATEKKCIVITPSHRYDGTNALLRKPANVIKTHYDEDSYEIHVQKAKELGVHTKILMSRRLMLDLDEPNDIACIMAVSSGGRTAHYLNEIRQRLKL